MELDLLTLNPQMYAGLNSLIFHSPKLDISLMLLADMCSKLRLN